MSRAVLQTRDGRRWRVADVGGRLAFVVVRRWPHATARRSTLLPPGAADAGRKAGARWEVSQRVARAAVDLRATMGGVAAGLWARGAG